MFKMVGISSADYLNLNHKDLQLCPLETKILILNKDFSKYVEYVYRKPRPISNNEKTILFINYSIKTINLKTDLSFISVAIHENNWSTGLKTTQSNA